MDDTQTSGGLSDDEKAQKMQSLRDMIVSAERTIHGAKSMLLQLEGKKKVGRRRKLESDSDGQIVEGSFDGQIMIGTDGKQYPVPANYASKSKLIEDDQLKLTIVPDGSFIYKQIGPAPRHNIIGIVAQDEKGNYSVIAEGKAYKVLLASVTYFKVEPGDEVVIVAPQTDDAVWATIDNILQHAKETPPKVAAPKEEKPQTATGILTGDEKTKPASAVDEWMPDIDEIEQEIKKEMRTGASS